MGFFAWGALIILGLTLFAVGALLIYVSVQNGRILFRLESLEQRVRTLEPPGPEKDGREADPLSKVE